MNAQNAQLRDDAVYLIDGSGYIFRAYYAVRPLSTSTGLPTNATYGFTQMLLKLLRDHKPQYLAIAFDTKTPTFRHALYPAYKGNRPPPPEDLIPQFQYIHKVVEAFGIKLLIRPGYEADDLIGTLAKKAQKAGHQVVIVTGDKDFMQLVGTDTWLLDELRATKTGSELFIDKEQVVQKFGVGPEHVVDVLALAGDASDNVPGVRGIGEKTASELVKEYGPLETILNVAPLLKQKSRREKLLDGADDARLSKQLVTIDCDVPMAEEIADLRYTAAPSAPLRSLFEELEFKRLLSDQVLQGAQLMPHGNIKAAATVSQGQTLAEYKLVNTEQGLHELAQVLKDANRLAIDTETDSLDPMRARLVGLSISWQAGHAAYLPVGHDPLIVEEQLALGRVQSVLDPILSDPKRQIIAQNAKYDAQVLHQAGFAPFTISGDPMLAHYLLEADTARHSLDEMSLSLLGHKTIAYEEVCGSGRNQISFAQVSLDKAVPYAAEDADVALRLADLLEARVREEGFAALYTEMELPLEQVLCEMEREGVLVDGEHLRGLGDEFLLEMNRLEQRAHEMAGMPFNLASPKQVGEILFDKLQLGHVRKTKTGQSTDANVLETLALLHPLPKVILEHRTLAKLKGTYVDGLLGLINPTTHRVHTSFNQAVTATGRLSSSDPNLQNIPARTKAGRRIREAFKADPGHVLISLDYSQIELRILADLSKDPVMTDAFMKGEDIHARTASEIFDVGIDQVSREQRNIAKTINFGLVYGMGANRLSQTLGISRTDAARYLNKYYERYAGLYEWQKSMLEQARNEGEVRTLFGRRRKLPEIRSQNRGLVQRAERMAINTPIQGTAADIMKRAMIDAHKVIKAEFPDVRMLLQVHDELLLEAHLDQAQGVAKRVEEVMRKASPMRIPATIEWGMGANWAEAH